MIPFWAKKSSTLEGAVIVEETSGMEAVGEAETSAGVEGGEEAISVGAAPQAVNRTSNKIEVHVLFMRIPFGENMPPGTAA